MISSWRFIPIRTAPGHVRRWTCTEDPQIQEYEPNSAVDTCCIWHLSKRAARRHAKEINKNTTDEVLDDAYADN